ncbi:hypothetical protein [Daejeonella oryzae]|uniref:hypothetical protein n=1 Tax=Daejeonella oryzae TaxID=1122943 RepID=UPI0003F92A1B|nr:hypothetical protein [Daejeonella oryzae]
MKKIIVAACGVIILSFMLINVSQAQILLPEVTVTSGNVPEKVDEAFKTTFKEAEDPKWYAANKNYLVRFLMNDMKNQAVFKKNGNIIYQIAYGYEKDLPEDVSSLVKRKYPDYEIVVAFNVKQDERNIWVVNMENEKNMIKVRVEDGEINMAERTRKSSKK